MERTFSETPDERGSDDVALLTYVLSYEDLLAGASQTFPLAGRPRTITLGRAADDRPPGFRTPAELRLADRWMSGEHARLERRGGDWILSDAGSRNGTYVDGARVVEPRPLADGALVEVGHALFCFRRVTTAAAAAVARHAEERRVGDVITHAPEMALLLGEVQRLAPSPQPILILAETGAGKESLAREIHRRSRRAGELVAVDCGAVPESLFESTFFGHRRGAFTGALENRPGEIARADGGTLFLDEVGNLAASSQAKLLRALEQGEVAALGAVATRRVDVRWVAATNRDLFRADGGFREDLLRRLAGHVARVPPLRRRRDDLGVLSAAVLRAAGVTRASITVAAARALFLGALPGNVRQLRAALGSAALLAGEGAIGVDHLPSEEPPSEPAPQSASEPPSAEAVEAALAATKGNVVRAAARLGAHPRQLYRWIERYALSLDKYRG
jgi:DNA-binding NtrC family response regulator